MALATVPSDTGPAIFPDLGTLSYNGIKFSTLYTSKLTSAIIQDNAKRTTKGVEWTLVVNGLVTLPDGAATTDTAFSKLRGRLSVQGGILNYSGKGFGDLIVNQGFKQDIAWGPIPKVIAFQPLGGSRSAFITWTVTTLIPEFRVIKGGPGAITNPVVQYNYEASISYDDEGYSMLALLGTLEIPMTRSSVTSRSLPDNVDNYRQQWLDIQFDLTKFRVTRRNFNVSRDKRTIDWEFAAEEIPPMGLPPGAMKARGTMSVRPMRSVAVGGGKLPVLNGCAWSCTLRATYTINKVYPRRSALWAFYSLLAYRLRSVANGVMPSIADPAPAAPAPAAPAGGFFRGLAAQLLPGDAAFWLGANRQQVSNAQAGAGIGAAVGGNSRRAQLMDFSIDEGIYLDSKTMTCEASWWAITTFETLLTGTGLWRYQRGTLGGAIAAASLENFSGWKSWLENDLDTLTEVIVDLGYEPSQVVTIG
jgi:hypothetical protein